MTLEHILRRPTLLAALVALSASAVSADERQSRFESGLVDRTEYEETGAERFTVEQRLEHYQLPGVAVALIENGEIAWASGYGNKLAGADDPVNADTVFSVGSVSKMVNAALILKLVEEGILDLDTDVDEYLESWKVPASRYNREEAVTLRRILSHTGGFNVHGFADFQPGETLPTTVQILEGSGPAKNDAVRLTFEPGDHTDYSGGGITVSQMIVEDVTGMAYADAAKKYVLEPLGMTRSTFVNPLPASHGNIARAHNSDGDPAALPRGWEAMPEQAASGLWTSARDLATFVIAINDDGPGAFLPQGLRDDMLSRERNSWYGLGPRLNGSGATRVFHHGGANDSYITWIEGHVASGDGLVILTNSRQGYFIRSEIHRAIEEVYGWPIKWGGGFEEPEL